MLSRREELAEGVTIILHSHGGQVGAYALSGLAGAISGPVHVVTCDMPVRSDMAQVYVSAKSKAASWTHLHSEKGWRSYMRWLGDGQIFSNPRELQVATRNIEVHGGHSGVLSDPLHLGQWDQILGGVNEPTVSTPHLGRARV